MSKILPLKYFLFFLSLLCYFNSLAQSYNIEFGDTINRIDKNGLKQGFWIEKNDKNEIWRGNYIDGNKNNKWDKIDKKGNIIDGILYKSGKKNLSFNFRFDMNEKFERKFYKKESKRRKIVRYVSYNKINSSSDSNLYISFIIQDEYILSKVSDQSSLKGRFSYLDSVNINVIEFKTQSELVNYINYNPNSKKSSDIKSNYKNRISRYKNGEYLNNVDTINEIYYPCILKPNKNYLVVFSKEKYISKSIIIQTDINIEKNYWLTSTQLNLTLSNRVIDPSDPLIFGYPSDKYYINYFGALKKDDWYRAKSKIIFSKKSEYGIKQKILEMENALNDQIINLKQDQIELENQKKLKE